MSFLARVELSFSREQFITVIEGRVCFSDQTLPLLTVLLTLLSHSWQFAVDLIAVHLKVSVRPAITIAITIVSFSSYGYKMSINILFIHRYIITKWTLINKLQQFNKITIIYTNNIKVHKTNSTNQQTTIIIK